MQRVLHPSIHDRAAIFNLIGPKVVGVFLLTIYPARGERSEW